jgi:hypothetical protein
MAWLVRKSVAAQRLPRAIRTHGGADYVAIELVENAETRSYYTAHKLPAIAQRVIKLYEGDTFSLSALADLLGRRLGLRRYSKSSDTSAINVRSVSFSRSRSRRLLPSPFSRRPLVRGNRCDLLKFRHHRTLPLE